MYIIRNALKCISRSKGRNLLIGIIVLVISISACIGLSIRQAAESAREDTLENLSVTATISFDRKSMMNQIGGRDQGGQMPPQSFDRNEFTEMMNNTSEMTLEEYLKYAEADSVKDFYYTLSASFNGTESFEAVTTETEETTENSANSAPNFAGFGGNGGPMGRFNIMSGDFQIVGYSSENAMTDFVNGTSSITEGSVFTQNTANYDCIISEELAAFNDITVGTSVIVSNPNKEEETYTLNVVGLYSDSSANESSFAMMGAVDPANKIYMSYEALSAIAAKSEDVSETVTDETTGRESETKISTTLSGTYTFETADDYYNFENEARNLGLAEKYTISSSDITSYENSLTPLNTLSTMAGWFLIVILIIGAVILIVLNIFNVRERKYEIGVLTAMGMKKSRVSLQFLTEIFVVTLAAVLIGATIGAVSSVPVTNMLLENQISSRQEQSDMREQNFGRIPDGTDFEGQGNAPSMPQMPENNRFEDIFGEKMGGYITEVNSAMNLTVVFQMLGISVLLTLISGAASMMFVMRYEPLKILANRD